MEQHRLIGSARNTPARNRALGASAAVFGLVTIFASSNVLFGPNAAREIAGDIVLFVVQFNLFAGFAYLAAALFLWRGSIWGHRLAILIVLATAGAGIAFASVTLSGAPVELRTGMALVFRVAFWVVLAVISAPRKHL